MSPSLAEAPKLTDVELRSIMNTVHITSGYAEKSDIHSKNPILYQPLEILTGPKPSLRGGKAAEAIHLSLSFRDGLLRFARNDAICGRRVRNSMSWYNTK
jgi:hypothetical protein